jgi:hypothetical protein
MKKLLLTSLSLALFTAANAQVLVSETFDGTTLPQGWTKTSLNPIGWVFGTPASLSSAYWTIPANSGNCAASNDDANDNNSAQHNSSMDLLITPSFDLSSAAACALSFDVFHNGDWGSTAHLQVSTDGGNTFTEFNTIAADPAWRTVGISLNAYLGNSDVKIAFRHNDNNLWAGGLAVDNVTIFIPPNNNASLVSITSPSFAMNNSDVSITGVVENSGANTITSVTVEWTAGTQNGSHTFDGLNVAPFQTYEFTHPVALELGNENVPVEVMISQTNGEADGDPSDNGGNHLVHSLLFNPAKKVLVEQGTGTWCGWCPRGHVFSEYMAETYPNSIEVAVHNNDPMTNATYDSGMSSRIGGYPSGLVDRFFMDIDPSEFEAAYLERIDQQTFAEVSVDLDYNNTTRNLQMTINANFAAVVEGNFRLNAIVVEDDVTGTTSAYNQSNFYSGGQAGPMGGYESLPNPVPASQMVYHHVGRRIMGGWNGTSGTIPAQVVPGTVYSTTYSLTLPTTWDHTKISVVGLIINQANENLVNAEESGEILSTNSQKEYGFSFAIFPNPASSEVNIALGMEKPGNVVYEVFDMTGKLVKAAANGSLAPGEYFQTLDVSNLQSGFYFVTVSIDGNRITKKLAVSK